MVQFGGRRRRQRQRQRKQQCGGGGRRRLWRQRLPSLPEAVLMMVMMMCHQ
jgi:hypothetical protein